MSSPSATGVVLDEQALRGLPQARKRLLAAIGAVTGAAIPFVTAFGLVDWTAAQTAVVTAEAGAVLAFFTALVAHVYPDSKQETVALAATFTALVSATIALGTSFGWWSMTEEQNTVLISMVTALIGVGAAMFARDRVVAEPPKR